jgi:hypothetical protein
VISDTDYGCSAEHDNDATQQKRTLRFVEDSSATNQRADIAQVRFSNTDDEFQVGAHHGTDPIAVVPGIFRHTTKTIDCEYRASSS